MNSRKLFSEFPYKFFVIALHDTIGVQNFSLSFCQSWSRITVCDLHWCYTWNCTALSQSKSSNFFMCIINYGKKYLISFVKHTNKNKSFPSSLVLLFQNECRCETILMKIILICMKMNLQAEHIFVWMAVVWHSYSFWYRGKRKLENGLLLHVQYNPRSNINNTRFRAIKLFKMATYVFLNIF